MLGDFGCSRIDADELTATFCGSNGYVAPEVLDRQGYTQAVDIYGIGVTLYEMVVGQLPFYHMKPAVLNRLIQKGELNIPSRIPEQVASFIRRTMCREVCQRLGANDRSELFVHEFFSGMDFEAMLRREVPCPAPFARRASAAINDTSEKLKLEAFGRKSFGARVSKCFSRRKPLEGFDYNTSFVSCSQKTNLSTISTNLSKTFSGLMFQSSTLDVRSPPRLWPCVEHPTDSHEL
jgi:serine/threonine protein kinase